MKIAIVEDEQKLARTLSEGLAAEGNAVSIFPDGELAVDALIKRKEAFDLIILDLGLPGMSGTEVSAMLRACKIHTPILILTAHDTIPDKVEALDAGADDFLAKPFNFDELMARMRALSRRTRIQGLVEIEVADLQIDLRTRSVKRQGAPIELTPTEFDLLYILIQRRGAPISRNEISSTLWNIADNSLSNIVDVHISNLRKKLDNHHGSKYISTIRGMGYQFA
jgi:two-component system copper resistance phosphate regulon response regulator CusR